MPIYEYRCTDCRRLFELRLAVEELSDEKFCNACGYPLELQVSRPAPFPVGKYGKGTR